MRQSLEAIKQRIMDYQKLNGFETILNLISEKSFINEKKDRLGKEVYLNVLPEKLSSDDLKLISDRIEWATLNTFINEKYNCLLIPEDKWNLVTNDLLDCVGEDKWKDEYDY